jgi:hypothetical protein
MYAVNFTFFIPTLDEIYLTRLEARETSSKIPIILKYLIEWNFAIFWSFFLTLGLLRKNKIFVGLAIIIIFTSFIAEARKSLLIGFLVTTLLVYLQSFPKFRKNFLIYFTLALSLVFFSLNFTKDFNTTQGLIGGLISRQFYTTGINNLYFLEYFNENLNQIDSQDVRTFPSYKIGVLYYGDPDLNANVNPLAESFAREGLVGIFMTVGALFILLILLDFLTQHSFRFFIPVSFSSIYSLCESNLQTAITTHGILILVIFSIVLNQKYFQLYLKKWLN